MTSVCISWALRKKKEIDSTKIDFDGEAMQLGDDQNNVFSDETDLNYISEMFQATTRMMLKKIVNISVMVFAGMSIVVWLFLEEKVSDLGQGIFFFIGAFGQIGVGMFIFQNHNMFDPRIIIFSRLSKWQSFDHIIKLNSYITLSNQAINLGIFASTYYISTFFGIDMATEKITSTQFERFHRRFLAFGFGSVFAYFIIKSLANLFCQGTLMVGEILSRQPNEGIEECHPKNPAVVLNNISESFLRIFQYCLEYNALTNMGLCIFQDFFVTRSVYLLDRGFLNSVAIYSVGMAGSLVAMLVFRNMNKFKLSDANEFNNKTKNMQNNGLMCILISAGITTVGALFIMWNTFPDSIAIYNPFTKSISQRNLIYLDAFLIFMLSFLIVLALVINSLLFTVNSTRTMKSMTESSKVCFTLNLLQSDFWSCFATVMPMTIFFIVLYINFRKASIFGITMEYLGIITYYQIIQFFQNFKCIYNFHLAILMASNESSRNSHATFGKVIESCRYFGKFSNGITLFILKILCFVILVDSFNINIVSSIIVIDPYYILGIVTGCVGIYCLTSLDIRSGEIFSKLLLQRIKRQVLRRINDDEYEPPYAEIANDMTHIAIVNQVFIFYIPTFIAICLAFILFGQKMVAIVLFGCFLLVLITCYPNVIKSELLIDMKAKWGEKLTTTTYDGVDPHYVGLLSFFVGNIYRNYGNDPHAKLLLLSCSAMLCSQFLIKNTFFLQRMFQALIK